GDGIGSMVRKGSAGEWYWGSSENAHDYCKAAAGVDCNNASNWNTLDPKLPMGSSDSQPFFIHYAALEIDATGVGLLTGTTNQVWKLVSGAQGLDWQAASPDFSLPLDTNQNPNNTVGDV